MTTPHQPSVSIVLPYINDYRLPFLEHLRIELDRRGIGLHVFYGKQAGLERGRRDAVDPPGLTQLRQTEFALGSKRMLIRQLPAAALRADLLVLEQATRNLESYWAIAWRRVTRRPTAQWGHGHTITEPQGRVQRILQRWMMKRSQWFFAYTPKSVDRGVLMGAKRQRSTVLYNTIDVAPLISLMEATPYSDSGRWDAVYIGALDSSKRIGFLLETAKRAFSEDPRFRLLVAGSGAEEKRVRDAEASGAVKYLGHIGAAEKAAIAKSAAVMLVPGRVGLVAVDSFALSLPVVTIDWPYHAPEFEYLNSQNAVVVADDASYLPAIRSLMQDPQRLAQLKQGCRDSLDGMQIEQMARRFADGVVDALRPAKRPERRALFQDWQANAGNPKGQLILLSFRFASRLANKSGILWLVPRVLVGGLYRICIEWLLGVEIPWRLSLGPRARIFHGQGTVVNDGAVIGSDVVLRHGITIGHKRAGGLSPRIGNRVEIGAGAIVLGDIAIGDDATIAAGAVVMKSVPAGTTVAGNPARAIGLGRSNSTLDENEVRELRAADDPRPHEHIERA
ncbi:serine acetyltransferase/glycosyltransferase involved in cell wall biosynthesis [Microbacterium trichothecenolyticum]|uniref:glycosyltransferase n=1 Tax=Microbacterium trichothecenolyticum TaxID=69370 RepID=UPI002863F804|nr:glycosyltransferase [Microbacterium trichothecenolyticum]MDR7112930.1 serine acetyltransferase/glycosyltransferase involved in cell wall biosynthesis [Microbacterium trichothecenolyticum]